MKHCLAIIGYGGMGAWHAKNVLSRIPDIHVKGAFDIRDDALEKARENGLFVYSNVEDLLMIRRLILLLSPLLIIFTKIMPSAA